jgi:hypothetical protein
VASKYKNEGLQIPAPSPFHRTITKFKVARLQQKDKKKLASLQKIMVECLTWKKKYKYLFNKGK